MSSLSEAAYAHIRDKLCQGLAGAGGELSEPALARELRMSRTPVREAIRRLMSEGLLEQRPSQGTFLRRPDRRESEELWELRLLLEPFAAARAAERIDADALDALGTFLDRMLVVVREFRGCADEATGATLLREHAALDASFHEGLLRAADNRRLLKVVSDVRILSRLLGYLKDVPHRLCARLKRAHAEHQRILKAVRRRDTEEARAAMTDHLTLGLDRARAYYDWLDRTRTAGSVPTPE